MWSAFAIIFDFSYNPSIDIGHDSMLCCTWKHGSGKLNKRNDHAKSLRSPKRTIWGHMKTARLYASSLNHLR